MRRLKFFLMVFTICIFPNVHALDHGSENYLVYEIAPTANNPGSIYIAPKIKLHLLGDEAGLPPMFVKSVLASGGAAYRITLSASGHLSAPTILPDFTVVNARNMGAVLSSYKLYDGRFREGSNNTFLLQGKGTRESVLLDIDSSGKLFFPHNFGVALDSTKFSNLECKDIDANGFDEIVTHTSSGYAKVAFYGFPDSLSENSGYLQVSQVGLLINDNDPYSVAIGEYYRVRRGIPAANIVHVQIPPLTPSLGRHAFSTIKAAVDAALPSTVQVIAVAWTMPYAVECNSITSALTRGFASRPCDVSSELFDVASPYYNSPSSRPYSDYGIRPSMLLAAPSIEAGKALIDRGIASDETRPVGVAHLMRTSDDIRSMRAINFPARKLGYVLSSSVYIRVDNAESISGSNNALFYFQGITNVADIATNSFPKGAVADNFTSFGGMLADSKGQTNILDFIAAGVTGTFGTVSEPRAHPEKFPSPEIVIQRYTNGETLIEAYWKSVSQTFQGLFVGEPLARPWY